MNKKTLFFVGKIALSGALIYWLLHRADLPTIWNVIKSADKGVLAFAFVMFYIGYFISAVRWRLLLKAQGINASIPFLLESFTIGMFFNNFLPSTIGGDASRMYDIYKLSGEKAKAVSVILTDRFMGMFSLISMGFVAALFTPPVQQAIPGIILYLGLVLSLMLVAMWTVFGSGKFLVQWFLNLKAGWLGIFKKIVAKVFDALSAFENRTDVLIKAIGLSFLLQLNVILHFVLIRIGLGIEVPVVAMFIIVPLAIVILLVPASINGVGVRDVILVFMFGIYGISSEQAIAFAWVWLGMVLAQGVVGGMVFLMRKRK